MTKQHELFDVPRREMPQLDRSAIAQALAKSIAYKQCGKDELAAQWARQLVELLHVAEILR